MRHYIGRLLAGLIAMAVSTAFGVERTFTNDNQTMSTAANWNPAGVPTAGDTGIIGGGGVPITATFTANLAGPPDAIIVRSNGAMKVYASMTTQHNIVMEGGKLTANGTYAYGGTISLRYESLADAAGVQMSITSLVQNAGADAGRLVVTNSNVSLSGFVKLDGYNNTYSGGTLVHPGVLQVSKGGALGTGPVELMPGSVLQYMAIMTQYCRTVSLGGKLRAAASYTITATNTAKGDLEFESQGTISVNASLAGVIEDYSVSEPTRLVKTGGGLLTLKSTNSYSGGTLIKEGFVTMSGFDRALGKGNVTVTNGAELRIGAGSSYVANPTWPGYEIEILNGATLRLCSGSSVYTTNIVVRDGGNIKGYASSGTYDSYDQVRIEGRTCLYRNQEGTSGTTYNRWSGSFRDGSVPGHLVYTGTGTARTEIAGAQLYTGGTEVENGGPQAYPLKLVTNGRLPDVGLVLVHAGATVDFNSINDGVGGLGGEGLVSLGSAIVTNYQGMSPGTNDLLCGTLTVTGTTGRLVLGAASTNVFHISEPGGADQVVLQGLTGLTLGGAIKLEGVPTLSSGTRTLFDLDGGPLTGTLPLLILPEGCSGRISTNSGDVVVTFQRAPGTLIHLR